MTSANFANCVAKEDKLSLVIYDQIEHEWFDSDRHMNNYF